MGLDRFNLVKPRISRSSSSEEARMFAGKLRVGMIGAGSKARHHLEAWYRSADAAVVAIYNRTQHKAESLAFGFAIPTVCAAA